ncbi:Thiol-disulfide isomerase or thioredoxin [Nocardioides scoriae]|uniref:Thiol-disulfide isomerase or thioredoxin n=1 Tax=Nocardioides scoriae TaxID=642780 RepID=A0A1H1UFR2_9ACTN|nr:TlpA disulfide reductase family protein [Nocardioides scoriae]SDS71121.1 Thiol-disulfide isomerase or thioredoxin [Nocardioides scoriae]
MRRRRRGTGRSARPLVVGLLAVLLAVVTAGCGSGGADDGPARPTSPRALPDVTLEALQGSGELDLGSIRGPAVVNLWASWCAPCRAELPDYAAYARKHAGSVDVIGIDFQDTQVDQAVALAEDSGVDYPLYADPDGLTRARTLPQIVLVDAEGRVRFARPMKITSVQQIEDLVAEHLGVAP